MAAIDKERVEEQWNKKRIFVASLIFFTLVAGVVYLGKTHFFPTHAALGIATQKETATLPTMTQAPLPKIAVQQKLEELKKEVNNLDVGQAAANSPQMKKVIHDLQSLQALPKDEAKQVCETICKGL